MTFPTPKIDDRRFQDLVREALDRIPAHTPEWTHLGESDPGVTLVELFAFLSESILYRANRIPDAARGKFLDLLGLKLQSAVSARGLVQFDASRENSARRLDAGIEVRSGAIPFRTRHALDVVPLESLAMVKEEVVPSKEDAAYYRMLYQSVTDSVDAEPRMYRTRVLDGRRAIHLADQTVDGVLWIALLLPEPFDPATAGILRESARSWMAGRYLSLGIAPWLENRPRELGTLGGQGGGDDPSPIARVEIPLASFQESKQGRRPKAGWVSRPFRGGGQLHKGPDVLEVQMPGEVGALDLSAWEDLDPLEAGVGDFPPALEDSKLAARVVGWLRVVPSNASDLAVNWAGLNVAWMDQKQVIANEVVGRGDGMPDQSFRFREKGVVPGSVAVRVIPDAQRESWTEIDDIWAAAPEVRWMDPSAPPGSLPDSRRVTKAFSVDAVEGTLRFGDGMHGTRPGTGTQVVVDYATSLGSAGNLPADSVRTSDDLPPSIKPRNPLPTWGGADAESVETAARRVGSWMRHRDRLVTAEDFAEIARRAPGVELGRIEVLPAWHPDLWESQPGDVPGVVTLMVLPKSDARDPARPMPDPTLLENLCHHLEPRRLITTELVLRGPVYVGVRISIGFSVAGGFAAADVRDRLEARIRRYLSPMGMPVPADKTTAVSWGGMENGWPLRREVNRLELLAEASREEGVLRIDEFFLGSDAPGATPDRVPMRGLELPWISALSVVVGGALPLSALTVATSDGDTFEETDPLNDTQRSMRRFPLPVVPETC